MMDWYIFFVGLLVFVASCILGVLDVFWGRHRGLCCRCCWWSLDILCICMCICHRRFLYCLLYGLTSHIRDLMRNSSAIRVFHCTSFLIQSQNCRKDLSFVNGLEAAKTFFALFCFLSLFDMLLKYFINSKPKHIQFIFSWSYWFCSKLCILLDFFRKINSKHSMNS